MSCDLGIAQIAGLSPPQTVTAPCPRNVTVTVINSPTALDAATFRPPMTICLVIRVGDRSVLYNIQTAPEEPPLPPGGVRRFTFTGVQFPCAPSATVTATADCGFSVSNNDRTNPSLTVSVTNIVPVPWLWTELRVGLKDSTGFITWDPGALCPGAELVAEAKVSNDGCAVAVASVTELNLLDGAGQSVEVLSKNMPSIAPGVTSIARFETALPAAVAGDRLTVRACADSTAIVTNQCDRQHACAETTRLMYTAGANPSLTFSAARPIFPGEALPISWRIQNFCKDLGVVTARILFQGVELHKSSPISIGLQDTLKGEDLEIRPTAAVAPTFYTFGPKQLTLELTGTGSDPGPYRTTTTVMVNPEPVSGTWAFSMPAPSTLIPWKGAYTVTGRLTNPAHATMSPSSLTLDETNTVGIQPITRNANPLIGPLTPGAGGTEAWSLTQTWSWLIPGVWVPKGAQGGLFTYTVTFAMQDEFGNAYPSTTSASLAVLVRVSDLKLALAASALALFETGVTLTALAFLALAGYYTAIGAIPLFTAAGIVFGAAAGAGAGALDPPVPDFDYRRVVPTSPPGPSEELADEAALAPLIAVSALLDRIIGLEAAMSGTEARLIGARIDRDEEAIRLQSGEYRDLRDSVLTAVAYVPVAVSAAIESEEARPVLRPPKIADLRKALRKWSSSGLPRGMRRKATAAGLPARYLKDFERTLTSPDFVLRPIEPQLGEISQAAANLGSAVQDHAEIVLNPPTLDQQLDRPSQAI